MLEQEIKLYCAEHDLNRIIPEVLAHAVSIHLQAVYFDTADHQLAQKQSALRIRSENGEWIQTFKSLASDGFSIIELNHRVSGPQLNLDLYKDHECHQVLSSLTEPLESLYRTDIRRLVSLHAQGSSTIEIAVDRGVISAGDLKLPVSEIEFELKSGSLADLFALTKAWIIRYSLKLDFRNKAQRGSRLAESSRLQTLRPASQNNAGKGQYFTLPSGIEEFLRRQNRQIGHEDCPGPANSGLSDIFKPLRDLPPMAQLRLLCSDLCALAELQDARTADVDIEYRLFLIIRLALILCQTMHRGANQRPDCLLALLLALHDAPEEGIVDSSIEESIDDLWASACDNTALLPRLAAALMDPALQTDMLGKLEYLLTVQTH